METLGRAYRARALMVEGLPMPGYHVSPLIIALAVSRGEGN